ncbi:MAG: hypothetical protein JNM10_11505 [Planctomycetia bacterium]|nr:hypothetical protein [Planctomycetia bacterium]
MRQILLGAGALALVASCFLAARDAVGEDPAAKPVAGIKDIMLAMNEGEHSIVGHLRTDFGGELDEDGWKVAKARATMLMEAANLLHGMKPPLGADDAAGLAKWKQHVMDYRGCADAAREAADKKDAAAGKAALMSLAKRCKECHADHRKEE